MSRNKKQFHRKLPREVKRALRLEPIDFVHDREAYRLLEEWKERDERCARRHGEATVAVERADARAALRTSRRRLRQPAEAALQVYDDVLAGRSSRSDVGRLIQFSWLGHVAQLARALRESPACPRGPIPLIEAVVTHGCIFQTGQWEGMKVMERIATYGGEWLRAPGDWRPRASSLAAQVEELTAHLFTRYRVPRCFRGVWFEDDRDALRWYQHLGQGGSIRNAPALPYRLSKRAVGHFHRAPAALTPRQALRYAQVRGLGGTRLQALALALTDLGSFVATDEPFWLGFIGWILRHPGLPPKIYESYVDWAHWRRHDSDSGEDGPLQPNLCMRTRSLEATTREVKKWLDEQASREDLRFATWTVPEGLEEWVREGPEGVDEVEYRVVPLASAKALRDEGRRMKHCVGVYVGYCVRGESAILSLRKSSLLMPGVRRLATLEVEEGQLVQAQAACNEPPSDEAWEWIRAWAKDRAIPISRHIEPLGD